MRYRLVKSGDVLEIDGRMIRFHGKRQRPSNEHPTTSPHQADIIRAFRDTEDEIIARIDFGAQENGESEENNA